MLFTNFINDRTDSTFSQMPERLYFDKIYLSDPIVKDKKDIKKSNKIPFYLRHKSKRKLKILGY